MNLERKLNMKNILSRFGGGMYRGFIENPLPAFISLLIPLIYFLGDNLLGAKDDIIFAKDLQIKALSSKLDSCEIRELRMLNEEKNEYKVLRKEVSDIKRSVKK
jgi:hypothetical protein